MTTTSPAEPEKLPEAVPMYPPRTQEARLAHMHWAMQRPEGDDKLDHLEHVLKEPLNGWAFAATLEEELGTRDAARVELNKAGSLIQEVGMHLQGLMSITKERGELAGMCYEAAEILRAALVKDSNQ